MGVASINVQEDKVNTGYVAKRIVSDTIPSTVTNKKMWTE